MHVVEFWIGVGGAAAFLTVCAVVPSWRARFASMFVPARRTAEVEQRDIRTV